MWAHLKCTVAVDRRVHFENTNTNLSWEHGTSMLAAERSSKSWRASSAPNASKRAKLTRRWGIKSPSQSAALPRIPISHPLPRRPSLPLSVRRPPVASPRARESPSVRRSCCASFLRYRLPVCPSLPLSRPPLPSHPKFTMFFAALSSPFPGRLCTYPTIRGTARRRGINERMIGCRS